MTNIAITNNIPVPPGGGNIIDVGAGSTLTITNGTFSGNGDSAISTRGTPVTLTNVTISGNTAVNAAGIDVKAGIVNLVNCTITGNIATAVGGIGGIRNAGTVNVKNTIIANNNTNNCSGAITSQGNNITQVAGCGLTAAGDIIAEPLLDALANNTGPVFTHALLVGSPAIDKGTAVGCPATDARGILRPVDGTPLDAVAATCDIGAFEFRPQKITVTLPPPFDFGTVTTGTTADHIITLANAGDGALTISPITAPAAPFNIAGNTCTAPLALGQSCTVTARFAPTAAALSTGTFNIPSTDPVTPTVAFAISGTGTLLPAPGILVTDSIAPNNDNSIPFGSVLVGGSADATITVTNNGTANLVVGQIASVDPLVSPFSILSDTCSGKTIAPAAACTLTVHFAPTASAAASDSLDIPSTGLPTVTVNVTGTGSTSTATTGTTGTGNNPPSNPVLVSPANTLTGVPTTMTFTWKKSADPDGDVVKYHFMYSTDPAFATSQTVDVAAAAKAAGLLFAGLGSMGGGFLLFGFVAGNDSRRSRKSMLAAVALILLGTLFTACGGGGGSSSTPTETTPPDQVVSTTVTGLAAKTTYYWKVVADDGKGGLASSEVFSFTTQ
jgi:ASPM-SPD-2-Hydin domain-containing protein/HYDIN/CFA65/VesB family protein